VVTFVLLGEDAHGWGLVCVGNVEHSTSNVECEKFDSPPQADPPVVEKFDVSRYAGLDVRFIS